MEIKSEEPGFVLGFGGRAEVGGYRDSGGGGGDEEACEREARRGRGVCNGVAEAIFAEAVMFAEAAMSAGGARGVGVARGRGGRRGAAAVGRGRGSARGAGSPSVSYAVEVGGVAAGLHSEPGDFTIAANSAGAGRRGAISGAASEQVISKHIRRMSAADVEAADVEGTGRTEEKEDSWSDRCGRGGRSNGTSTLSQERRADESLQVDASLEGQQKQKGGKGKNFVAEEERQLARSVLKISQDPITGNGQKGSAFWERIFKHYNDHRPFDFRPARSLESKWSLIKQDVSKFVGVLQQCSYLSLNGASAADVQRKALELYRLKTPKNAEFAYLHVWEIVKDVPRWHLGCTQEKTNAPVMKRKDVPDHSDTTFLQPDTTFLQPSSSTDGEGGSPSTFNRPRPHGSKHAKEDRRVTALRETAALAQATATKAMADAMLKKTQIMEDANLFLLMTHSTDGAISDTAARYLKLRQEEELEKLEIRMAEARARKANVQQSPPPVSMESADVLQRRVAEAMGAPTRRHAQQRSTSSVQERYDHDGTGGSHENLEIPLVQDGSSDVHGDTAAVLGDNGDHGE